MTCGDGVKYLMAKNMKNYEWYLFGEVIKMMRCMNFRCGFQIKHV